MSSPSAERRLYGLIAEFTEPEALVRATRDAYTRGYRMMEAYTPFPVEGLADALGFHRNFMAAIVFAGGFLGGTLGFFMQWYSAVVSFPIDVAGRPLNSWPSFIPITFEMTVLGAALAAVFGMLGLNGLPRPHHPVFGCRASLWRRATGSSCACKLAIRFLKSQRHVPARAEPKIDLGSAVLMKGDRGDFSENVERGDLGSGENSPC